MPATLRYLGGASEVGRIGAILEGNNGRLLLDYGLQPDDPPKYPLPAPEVDALLLTHAHLDHIGAISEIKAEYSIPFYLHIEEKTILDSYLVSCRMFGMKPGKSPSVDKWLDSSGELLIGPFKFLIIETPGHTPGGCSFLIDDIICW